MTKKDNSFNAEIAKLPAYLRRHKNNRKENALRCAKEPTPFLKILDTVLDKKGRTEEQKRIFELYNHWEMVLDDLATLALPIGHKARTLLIGAEDNYALSDLIYAESEILMLVNAFMGEEYFEKVEMHLLQGKTILNALPENNSHKKQEIELIRPENLGNLNLPDGPVKDAYMHYLSLFEK